MFTLIFKYVITNNFINTAKKYSFHAYQNGYKQIQVHGVSIMLWFHSQESLIHKSSPLEQFFPLVRRLALTGLFLLGHRSTLKICFPVHSLIGYHEKGNEEINFPCRLIILLHKLKVHMSHGCHLYFYRQSAEKYTGRWKHGIINVILLHSFSNNNQNTKSFGS